MRMYFCGTYYFVVMLEFACYFTANSQDATRPRNHGNKVKSKPPPDPLPEFRADKRELDCPSPGTKSIIPDLFYSSAKIPLGVPGRALMTAPEKWVVIQDSSIPRAGLGAFAATFIPANTWLAEYEGEVVTSCQVKGIKPDGSYMWNVKKAGKLIYYIDAIREESSNWLRYINCASTARHENVKVHFCYGKPYYRTARDVRPGEELMVYYGEVFAEILGIDPVKYLS